MRISAVDIILNASVVVLMSAIILFLGVFDINRTAVIDVEPQVLGEQIQADKVAVEPIEPDVVTIETPTTTSTPAPQPSAPVEATSSSPYPANSVGQTMNTNAATRTLLARAGLSEQWLWDKGIKVLPYNGPVRKKCALSTTVTVAGLAVKHNASYPKCDNGEEVIYPEYRTAGKCTVIYDWTNYNLGNTARGNSYAVLMHEIGHCLHFLYGEYTGFQNSYFTDVRPEVADDSRLAKREVLADDFMICRFGADTSWSRGYYDRFGVNRPSADQCARANQLFAQYFGV